MQTTEPRIPQVYDIVSAGTLNSEDLIPAYASYLRGLGYDLSELEAEYPWMDDDYDEVEAEDLDDCLAALTERLEEIAPEYVYFSASEGDGACFGFWPLMPDDYDDNVVRIDAGTPWHYCAETYQTAVFGEHARVVDAEYALVVNDHGNATLYRVSGEEVWSVV